MHLRLRAMTPADCDRVSEIRVRGWQTAYRDLIPRSHLDGLDVARDAERRRELLARGDGRVVNLVAEQDGEVVGWTAYGPYRDGGTLTGDAEVYALYVHPGHLGRGVGRALLTQVADRCLGDGHDRLFLWVLKGNTRARHFYGRAGFHADGAEEPFEGDGFVVPEVRYVKELRD